MTYQVDGVDVAAGTYPGTGTVVVTAVAQTGYALSGATSFSLPFTDIHQVAAEAPGHVDTFRTASDTYTVPSVPGVRYLVDGVTAAAGTYPGTGTVVVTAVAEDGYELTGPDSFTLVFTDLQPATPVAPVQQDKGGTADDTYTLPAVPGITYLVGGVPVARAPTRAPGPWSSPSCRSRATPWTARTPSRWCSTPRWSRWRSRSPTSASRRATAPRPAPTRSRRSRASGSSSTATRSCPAPTPGPVRWW